MATQHFFPIPWKQITHVWLRDWGGITVIGLGFYALIFCLWLFFGWGGPQVTTFIASVAFVPVIVVLAVLALRVAYHTTFPLHIRQAWLCIALSCVVPAVGLIPLAYLESIWGLDAILPWVIFVVGAPFPLMTIGVLLLPTKRGYPGGLTFWLDALTVVFAVVLFAWFFILQSILRPSDQSFTDVVLALISPVGDILLIFSVIAVALSYLTPSQRQVLLCVGGGLFLFASADLLFLYLTLQDNYQAGNPIDLIWMLSIIFISIGAHVQYHQTNQQGFNDNDGGRFSIGRARYWLPYVAVILSCGLLVFVAFDSARESVNDIIVGVILITTLVVSRQIVVMRHNEKLLAEKLSRDNESRFVSLVQNASDIIAIVDADSTIRYITPSTIATYGYTPEELTGTLASALVHPADHPRLSAVFATIREKPATVEPFTCRIRHQNGSWLDIETSAANLLADPLVQGIVLTSRDIGDRKAREVAEAANKAKSSFLSHMSHELRTPLTAVIGYADLVRREAELRNYGDLLPDLDKIRGASVHLMTLINNVLDLSKIESGRFDIMPETFEMSQLISDVADTIHPLIIQQNNTLMVEISDEFGSVYIDPLKLRQILLNLLANATKFTTGGVIRLYVERIENAGPEVIYITVSDTGVGMSHEQQRQLFTPFVQSDNARKNSYDGTGLGLALCKYLCEAMGGSIDLNSVEGQGTTVSVSLPAHVRIFENDDQLPSLIQISDMQKELPLAFVIEEDQESATFITELLRDELYDVVVLPDNNDGERLITDLNPHLIIISGSVSATIGENVISALRSRSSQKDLPVIVIAEQIYQAVSGANHYLSEPLNVEQLREILQSYHTDDNRTLAVNISSISNI
ncbi:MAG: ATP-binding protein [Chloroflexota bacterium]